MISSNPNGLYNALIITSSTQRNIIYRKGNKDTEYKQIATVSVNQYLDYKAPAGDTLYFVRSISDTGYNDSDVITTTLSFAGIVLSGPDESEIINLWKTKDSDKRPSIVKSKDQYRRHFSGRTYPITQSNPFRDHVENHEYFIPYSDYEKFCRIIDGNTVFYKNADGHYFPAEISNVNMPANEFGINVTFTLARLEE
jgi:hypothetical protein